MKQPSPSARLFDREPELAQLRSALADADQGGCFLLSGDPGIGKTQLLGQICRDARDDGVTVLAARCAEQAGAPPWWPWMQILRSLDTSVVDSNDQRMLGAISEPSEVVESSTRASSAFRQFAAVTNLLRSLTEHGPLVIAFDDIHWADEISLRLLEHLVLSPEQLPMVFVATYRDAELSRNRPLGRSLNRIATASSVERIRLGGLTIDGTSELMSSISNTRLSFDLVKAIHQQTDGNPFFVAEISRYLLDAGYVGPNITSLPAVIKIPESIRDVVSERLDRLSSACREVLESASVLGRNFDQETLQLMRGDVDNEVMLTAIDEAIRAHVITESADSSQLEFAHALLREAVYDELSRTRRMGLHRHAAEALATRRTNTDVGLAVLANHWLESATPGAAEKAADCFGLAGQRASGALAFGEAVSYFEQAVDCLEARDESTSLRVAELLLQLGEARRRAGRIEASMEAFDRAAQIGESTANQVLEAQAALGYENARWRSGLPAQQSVTRIKRVLSAATGQQPALRVKLLASLARASSYSSVNQKSAELALESIDAARQLDDDALLCDTLTDVYVAFRGSAEHASTRLALCEEQLQLASDLHDDARIADALSELRSEQLEHGDLAAFDETLTRYERLASRLKEPHHLYQLQFVRATRGLIDGRYDDVPKHANQARDIGQAIEGADAAGVHAIQMFQLCRDTGRLGMVAPFLENLVAEQAESLWQPGLALLHLELGQIDQAAEQFDRLATRDFSTLTRDELWTASIAFAAEVCARIKDAERAKTLFALLRPYQGRLIVLGPAVACFGPADRYLGLLAATLGQIEEAMTFLTGALEQAQQIESPPWAARTMVDLATLPIDGAKSSQWLERALKIAKQIDMDGLLARCEQLSGGHKLGLGLDALTKREVDVLRLLAAGISNKEISSRLHISNATVATHVRNLLSKTGAKNRTEAVALALREGIVTD